jgi:hypothetical protein
MVSLHPDQYASLNEDGQSLLHGETRRYWMLLRTLAQARYEARLNSYPPAVAHRMVTRKLYDYYFGLLTDDTRAALPMYEGDAADFESNLQRFKNACNDVEATLRYLTRFLPKEATKPTRINLQSRLQRPNEVETDDPVELITLAGHGTPNLRHHARVKLCLAQFRLEEYRHGYAPELLRRQARDMEAFLRRRLFTEAEGEPITILVDRDPNHSYCCTGWTSFTEKEHVPEPKPHQYLLRAERLLIRAKGRDIRVLFFIRPKEHIVLKALVKDRRFLDLMDIGDGIAMMFVVDRDDLADIVPLIRQVTVRCPGQVSDQGSSIGYRVDKTLDPQNKWSSRNYEAEKFCLHISDRIAEIQFVPKPAWVNSLCMHDEVNHGLYKLRKYLEKVFPILWPEHLTGIPWQSRGLRQQIKEHVLALVERGIHL